MDIKDIKAEMFTDFKGQIIQVLRDKKDPSNPQWFLYRLIDGTGEIALFNQKDYGFKVGEFIEVSDVKVKKGERGLSANPDSKSVIKKLDQLPKSF